MDSALRSAPFPSYTTQELRDFIASGKVRTQATEQMMRDEIARREAVEAGDISKMTPGERLWRTARR